MRPISFAHLRTFCQVDGWVRKADTPGHNVRKHEVWTKTLPDGAVLRTVISKGAGEYSPQLASRIITRQLQVTEDEFWAAVRHRRAPDRGGKDDARPQTALLPLALVQGLLAAGRSLDELRGLTPEEARRLLDPS